MTHPLLTTAFAAAEAAAAVQRRWAGRIGVREASLKGANDYVSAADLEAQAAALEVIRSHHPWHRIMAEEEAGPIPPANGDDPVWVVDPIDGTTNFLHGHPMYAASVTVVVSGEAEAGVVIAPATGERWWATRGGGAFKNGQRLRVSEPPGLETALVGTGFPFKVIDQLDRYLGQLERVVRASAGVRRCGAAALDLAYLSSGALDAFWELYLAPWDVMAGVLLIQEAGGVVTRIDGTPIDLVPGTVLGAANAELAGELTALLRRP